MPILEDFIGSTVAEINQKAQSFPTERRSQAFNLPLAIIGALAYALRNFFLRAQQSLIIRCVNSLDVTY